MNGEGLNFSVSHLSESVRDAILDCIDGGDTSRGNEVSIVDYAYNGRSFVLKGLTRLDEEQREELANLFNCPAGNIRWHHKVELYGYSEQTIEGTEDHVYVYVR